jgi:hypothetical protein
MLIYKWINSYNNKYLKNKIKNQKEIKQLIEKNNIKNKALMNLKYILRIILINLYRICYM